jgi:redox-sensing transcriptional repressor
MTERGRRRIPDATVARLPVYLRSLLEIEGESTTVSSERLAELAGVNAAKVRKDLSYLGSYGTRGVGYDVEYLLFQMSRELGLTQHWPVVIVGIGNLGHALANYDGFGASGFHVVAIVDADPAKVGQRVGGSEIRPLSELDEIVRSNEIAIGIIATPAIAAQDVADRLVAAGVTSILNFAPAVLTVPTGVSLRKVDLAVELQILSFHQQRRGTGKPVVSAPDGTGDSPAPYALAD